MNPYPFFLSFAWFLLATVAIYPAIADEIEFGVGTSCTVDGFQLSAIVEHNDETSALTPSLANFHKVPYGKHTLICKLKKTVIRAKLRVDPADNGRCYGAGYVSLDELKVGNQKFFDTTAFNWNCPGQKMLVKIAVLPSFRGEQLSLQKCYADDWDWDKGFINLTCEFEDIK